jgi:ketosteroid isomerase-like protein
MSQNASIPGEGTKLIRTGYEAFARGDIATVLALFDPQIIWTTPGTVAHGGTYTGPGGVAEFFGHLAEQYDELAVLPEKFVEQGGDVVVIGTLRGHSSAGNDLEQPFVHCWELSNGLVTTFTEFYDTVLANAALGVPAAIDLVAR